MSTGSDTLQKQTVQKLLGVGTNNDSVMRHSTTRADSQFDNSAPPKDKADDSIRINAEDVKARDITDGGPVSVYNDRWRLRSTSRVSERIMPGGGRLDAGVFACSSCMAQVEMDTCDARKIDV